MRCQNLKQNCLDGSVPSWYIWSTSCSQEISCHRKNHVDVIVQKEILRSHRRFSDAPQVKPDTSICFPGLNTRMQACDLYDFLRHSDLYFSEDLLEFCTMWVEKKIIMNHFCSVRKFNPPLPNHFPRKDQISQKATRGGGYIKRTYTMLRVFVLRTPTYSSHPFTRKNLRWGVRRINYATCRF